MGLSLEADPILVKVTVKVWVKPDEWSEPRPEPCPVCEHLVCSTPDDFASLLETGHHPNCPTTQGR